ncbi:MAG: ABC transporter permease subunit [Defluviitaleaceae bacterium]|nr:ABC transporter permease subunit [Defluviitaleaceae bacterium]
MENTLTKNKKAGYWRGYWSRHWSLYAMLLLPVVFIFIFRYVPMVHLYRGFAVNNTIAPLRDLEFVGLDNFRNAFTNQIFINAIRNTLLFSALDLLLGFPAPIILALLLNELKFERFKKITQSISYVPNFISWVIVGGLATTLFSTHIGAVNGFIESWGFEAIPFLEREGHWIISNVLISIWRGVGWSSIIYLAAITNISPELYEAAEIDGASRLRKMWHITLPGIRPVIATLFTLALGGIMAAELDRFVALENSFVRGVSEVIPIFVWRWGLQANQFALATVIGIFQGIIGMIMLLSGNWFVKKMGGAGFW